MLISVGLNKRMYTKFSLNTYLTTSLTGCEDSYDHWDYKCRGKR
jgi:hypothetical protein